MDFWKYLSEGKGVLLSEELDFPVDGNESCKNKAMGCEIKPFSDVENYPLVSNTQAIESSDLMDLGFSDEIRRSYSMSSEPSGEVFSDEIGSSYGNVVSPFCEGKELGSRISIDFVQSNNQDFSLINLKLGRLVDDEGFCAKDDEFSNVGVPVPSSTMSSPPAKRAPSTTLYPRPPCCQVLGCNKDLSSCKGYYKRHKVCDVHTKTAKVIVDGIEQRFCQQCSRFHLLAEFDDGKRSCRRRLAAHNKRRRKPQLTSESGEGRSNVVGGVKDNIVALQRLSDVQQTSHALSLLSTRSHNMSSQCLEAATPTLLMNQSSHADTEIIAHYPFHAPATAMLYSGGSGHVKTTTIDHRDGDDAISRVPADMRNVTTNYHYNQLGHGVMLDLFELSSHLQRVEQQQRHSTESETG